MTAWENKSKAIKTSWTETKRYFEGLVCNFKIYKQNSGGTTEKINTKEPIKPPKLPKVTNSGTKLPPLQQQRLPETKSRTRLPPTFARACKRKPMKWHCN